MAAIYHTIQPLWLAQEQQGLRSSDAAKRFTVESHIIQYKSRSDDVVAARPSS